MSRLGMSSIAWRPVPMGDSLEEHEDLIEKFVDAAEAIVDITSAQHVINNVFG